MSATHTNRPDRRAPTVQPALALCLVLIAPLAACSADDELSLGAASAASESASASASGTELPAGLDAGTGTGTCIDCCTEEEVLSPFRGAGTPSFYRGAVVECFPAVAGAHYVEGPNDPDGEILHAPPQGFGVQNPILWGEVAEDLLFDWGPLGPNEVVVDTMPAGAGGFTPSTVECTPIFDLDSLGRWSDVFRPDDADPDNGVCDCEEDASQIDFVMAASPFMGRAGTPFGRMPPRSGTPYRRRAHPLTPGEKVTFGHVQTWRANSDAHADNLRQTAASGGGWRKRRVISVGRGPNAMVAMATIHDVVQEEGAVLAVGLTSHFEHFGGFEMGQTVVRFALPNRRPFNQADFDPATYAGPFTVGARDFVPYGAVSAVAENFFSNYGPAPGGNAGPVDQIIGRSRRIRRQADGSYALDFDHQSDNGTGSIETNRVVISTGFGRPRTLATRVYERTADSHPGEDARTRRARQRFVEGNMQTIETLFARSWANYMDSFEPNGVRRRPARPTDFTELENMAHFYAGQDVLVWGAGASGLMAADHLHNVVPALAGAHPNLDEADFRPRKIILAHRGDALSDAGPLGSLLGGGPPEGQYRRIWNTMQGGTGAIEDRVAAVAANRRTWDIENVDVTAPGPGGRRRLLVRFSDGSTVEVDRIVTAIGQVTVVADSLALDASRESAPILSLLRPLRTGNRNDGEIVGLWDGAGLVFVGPACRQAAIALTGPDYAGNATYAAARLAATGYMGALARRTTAVQKSDQPHEGPRAGNDGSLAVHGAMIQEAMRTLSGMSFFDKPRGGP
jgi:hypothetical protein